METLPEKSDTSTEQKETGLSAEQFSKFIDEIRFQPSWRKEADKCADYYDDNQIDGVLAEELAARGMGPLITNLIKPTINVVLGQEAKTRTDWRVTADGEETQDFAEAMSAKLMEAERESRADRACSDAYANQIKTGLGWVEVTRETDPFKYKYRVSSLHRREMFWDWSATKPDLSDAKYLIRQRWFNVDQLAQFFPQKAELIRNAGNGWSAFDLIMQNENVELMHAFDTESRISFGEWNWRDTTRKVIALFECWYKTYETGKVIDLPDGRTVVLDLNNPAHQLALANGIAFPRSAVYSKTHCSLWIGPHKLVDFCYGTKNYPYIPFWGYREDLTNIPYGLIRSMIPLQDEVNARRRKLLWLLSAKSVKVDSDALDQEFNSFNDLIAEISRPDSVIVMNPDRRNQNGIEIDHQAGLASQQFDIMQDSKNGIQEVAGVFNAMMGRDSGATSGLAINSLVEQGNAALAEINDNYRYSRMAVGEALLELLIADMHGKEITVVTEGVSSNKTIILNRQKIDDVTGLAYRENDVSKIRCKVALHDVPSTPAYRMQQLVQLGETLKSLPPDMQALLTPFYIESTDHPKRKEMAKLLRQKLGIAGEGAQDPAVLQLQQQVQELIGHLEEVAQQGADRIKRLEEALNDKSEELSLKHRALDIKEADSERQAMQSQEELSS